MRRVLVAATVVVAIVVAGVALSTSSAPSRRVRVVGHGTTTVVTVPPSRELTTTTTPPVAQPPTTAPQPPTTAPQSPSPPTTPGSYTVAAGDTLGAVAAAHGLDWPGLCAANRLADCNRIYPGQVLELKSVPTPCCSAFPPSTEAPNQHTPATAPAAPAGQSDGFGCGAALAYLAAHQAPGFTDVCAPHSARGHYGLTVCNDTACSSGTIYIACPDATVYRNEASNSFALAHLPPGSYDGSTPGIDPYGQQPASVSWTTCNTLI